KAFLDRVVQVLECSVNHNYAIFVFGSLQTKDHSSGKNSTSDIDLLILFPDNIPEHKIAELNILLRPLEYKYLNVYNACGLVSRILMQVEQQTGMHKNLFLTREEYLIKLNFKKIFGTNSFLSYLLAPKSIVLGSVLSKITPLKIPKGMESTISAINTARARLGSKRITFLEFVQSTVMDVILSLSSLFLYPITKRATRYSIEAFKWATYSMTYALIGSIFSKSTQVKFFVKLGFKKNDFKRWLDLSKNFRPDPVFALKTPLNVLKIHLAGFKYKKMRKP
ncbi:MAG: nucleotidyltransferase domain-containing protein, partial [Promethearchaeota archaeon]